jgi:predicted transcriptional regulator
MKKDPVTISPSMTVDDVIENYFYRYHFKMFPVVEESQLLGCVTINQIKHVAPEERKNLTVKEILSECTDENTISADSDAVKALSKMNRTQSSRLMVKDNGHLEGIIALKDMMKFLSTKIELEEDFR